MNIAEFSVNRKITTIMLTILVLILGGISFTKLGLEMLPDMNYPVISIITTYEGASSQDVEQTITKTIETAVATVKDIKSLKSESIEGVSLVMVEFNWGTNLDFAAQDLRDMIDQIADYLPADVSRPLVMKYNLSQMPILMYGATGGKNTYYLRKILDDEVAAKLKTLKGVASVMVMGGDEAEKQIIVDKEKLAHYGISINDVVRVVGAENLNMAAGHIQNRKDEYLLRTIAEYKSNEDIADTPVKITKTGKTIFVKDIAEVHNGYKEKHYYLRTNRKPTAMFMVSKESGTNTLTVAKRVKKEIETINKEYGDRLNFYEIMDLGLPITKVTHGAVSNLLIGGFLAIIIMFIFLRNWRPTLAISLAIPISVIVTFLAMKLADFTLNLMTLGGLALGVGMLVDNSVVVIENIYRHLEMGESRIHSAKVGTTEVAMAITASTLTTIAVFFPMLFATGITGVLVRGLALTVAFSLFSSLLVSLTIVPVIASMSFKHKEKAKNSKKYFFDVVKEKYLKLLQWVLHHRTVTIVSVLLLFLLSLAIIPTGIIGTEFLPEEDIPFMMMRITMPSGTSLQETNVVVKQIEGIISEIDGVKNLMVLVGPMSDAQAKADPTNPQEVNESQIYTRLYEKKERTLSYQEIQEKIRSRLPKIEGAKITFISRNQMMGGGPSNPIELSIFGKDLKKLKVIGSKIEDRMKKIENVTDVVNSMKQGKPEVHIVIDKDKAFQYGLTSAQIAAAVKTATIGTVAGVFRKGGEETDIRVRLREEDRNSFIDIDHIAIVSPLGITVPLNQIAHLEKSEGPIRISHEHQTRKVSITANIAGTKDIGGTVQKIKYAISDINANLEPGYFIDFGGSYKDMKEAFISLAFALLLAIILVYIVMASQFESLTQPFIVMFTLPLGIIGVILILILTKTTLSVVSFVGIIILSGIVVNNGIVLIDRINQLRQEGKEKFSAIIQGGSDRIRPVLITATTTIIGMLPMALSTQEGSELKAPMALTVIGGLFSATFFTLVIIPIIYSLLVKETKKNSV